MLTRIRPLRVLMVSAQYFPIIGGIETHVYEVGRRLVRDGVDVTILTTRPRSASETLLREETQEGMRIIRVYAWPSGRDYRIAPEMYPIIKNGTWDLVHCQGCHTFVPPLAMLAAKQAKIPYVVTFHTGGNSSHLRNAVREIQWFVQRSLLIGAAKLIGVSQFEANYFRTHLRLSRKRFVVIPNGSTILPEVTSSSSQVSTLIISLGRLERYKGHQRLITALPKIREYRPDARLLILGVGPYERELRTLAQQTGMTKYVDIHSVPAHDRQAMAEVLSQAAVVALLSEYEAHPVAVVEALALRRPVVVADTSGMSELAQQGLVRAIPLHSSSTEVAQAILHQIEEPLVSPINFSLPSWDECAQQVRAVYSQCVSEQVSEQVCVS